MSSAAVKASDVGTRVGRMSACSRLRHALRRPPEADRSVAAIDELRADAAVVARAAQRVSQALI